MFRYRIATYSFFIGLLVHACTTAQGVHKIIEDSASTETATNQLSTEQRSQTKECPICLEPFSDTDQKVSVDSFHDFHERCMRTAMLTDYELKKQETNEPGIVVATEIEFWCPMCRGKVTNRSFCTQVKQEIQLSEVEKYIQDGYDPNAIRVAHEHTLLHLLARQNQAKVVEKLIAAGAELNAVNSQAWTPLHSAADVGATDVIALLLARGADKDAPNDWSWTPLHLAVQSNRIEAMRLLIEKGANIEAEANMGFEMQNGRLTPLHLAACFGHKEAMQVLLDNQARVDAQAVYGFTPLHIAALCSNIAFLERRHSDRKDCIAAEQAKYQACMDVLLGAAADPTLQNEYGQTHQALQTVEVFDPKLISLFK